MLSLKIKGFGQLNIDKKKIFFNENFCVEFNNLKFIKYLNFFNKFFCFLIKFFVLTHIP